MEAVYEAMARTLAPFQGRPHGLPQPVGDPAVGSPARPSPDAGTEREVAQVYAPLRED